MMKTIGVISDTHGLLRGEAAHALEEADLIIHAGDIGSREVIDKLKKIASVIAVRGNCDREKWVQEYPKTETVEVGGKNIYVIHDIKKLDITPEKAGMDIVISGHSHRPRKKEKGDVLYINPGSAGPRRFNLPVCIARININGDKIGVDFIEL